mmetsp:Transcript_20015/g.59633  ORF Transcript_20015/g.59633 Transcript_20015/m.59633 type:complete len:195 (+) Transcript_20015:119-703(+)
MEPVSYELFYHSSAEKFYGRALGALLMLEETSTKYTVRGAEHKPGDCFAVPAIKNNATGTTTSQTAAIAYLLGHELGLAPADPAADIKCLQLCCDATDFLHEEMKPDDMSAERKAKWLAHFANLLGPMARPLTYADFMVYAVLQITQAAFTGVLDASGEPGLKAWLARMEATKGVQALKGKGKTLWPGDNQKPW